MSYYDSEINDKAKEWNIPLEPPRTISGKFTVFQAAPALSWVGIIFLPIGLAMGILFFSLGLMNDILVEDWTPAEAKCLEWINSTGERINGKYVPGIRVLYTVDDGSIEDSIVKVSDMSKIPDVQKLYSQGSPLYIEYSKSRPNVAKIAGMSASAIPAFLAYLPLLFIVVAALLIFLAIMKRGKVLNVLENGQLAVGKIVDISRMSNQRSRRSGNSNNTVRISYDFSIDNEIFVRKAFVSTKTAQNFEVDQEIPVIYQQMNMKMRSYSPAFYNVAFGSSY